MDEGGVILGSLGPGTIECGFIPHDQNHPPKKPNESTIARLRKYGQFRSSFLSHYASEFQRRVSVIRKVIRILLRRRVAGESGSSRSRSLRLAGFHFG